MVHQLEIRVNGVDGADGLLGADGSQGFAQYLNGFYIPESGTQGDPGTAAAGGGGGGGGGAKGCQPVIINPLNGNN